MLQYDSCRCGLAAARSIKLLVQEDGNTTEDIEIIKGMAHDFYNNLYTLEGVHDMEEVLNTVPLKVTMNEQLCAQHTLE